VVVGFGMSPYELVVGVTDALEGLDQETDDVGDNLLKRGGCRRFTP